MKERRSGDGWARAAVVKDPEGAVVGLYEGPEDPRDWSAPPPMYTVCWTELMTRDPGKAAAFYGELTNWMLSRLTRCDPWMRIWTVWLMTMTTVPIPQMKTS